LNFVIQPIWFVIKQLFTIFKALHKFILSCFRTNDIEEQSSPTILKIGWENSKNNDFSPEFKDLVFKMLAYNGVDRPSIEQIKEHPWL
jgi:serine/threonine protein kinase